MQPCAGDCRGLPSIWCFLPSSLAGLQVQKGACSSFFRSSRAETKNDFASVAGGALVLRLWKEAALLLSDKGFRGCFLGSPRARATLRKFSPNDPEADWGDLRVLAALHLSQLLWQWRQVKGSGCRCLSESELMRTRGTRPAPHRPALTAALTIAFARRLSQEQELRGWLDLSPASSPSLAAGTGIVADRDLR